MQNSVEDNEIELYDYLKILFRYKYFIVIVTFVSVVLAVAIGNQKNPVIRESNIKLKLLFGGVQNGLYPDGSRFKKNDMINPKFLVEAVKPIDIKNYGLDREELSLRLRPFIREIIPELARKKGDALKKSNSLEKFEFFPDEFEIYIQEPDDMIVPAIVREEVLEGITENWIAWFESRFIKTQLSAVIVDKIDFSEYEFFNIIDLIQSNVENAKLNIRNIPNDLRGHRSIETGLNSDDLEMMLNAFVDNDLFRLRSIIDVEGIYKNKPLALKYLEYKIKFLTKKKNKAGAEYKFVSGMMERVENSGSSPYPALLALMFSKDISNMPGAGNEKEGEGFNAAPDIFQTLAIQATRAGVESTAIEEEIKFIQEKIDDIKSSDQTALSDEKIIEVETKLKALADKAINIIKMMNTLQVEVNEKQLKDSIKVTSDPVSYELPRGLKKIRMISFVAGLFGAVFLSFFINYIREHSMVSNDRVIK